MSSPIISSFSPTTGPAGQWIYMFGSDFVEGGTQVYFNTASCSPVYVYDSTQLGVSIPLDVDGNGILKVITPEGECTSSIEYVFDIPIAPPTVSDLRDHPDPNSNWVYVDGTQLVENQTTLTYGDNTVNVFVYTTTAGGFSKVHLDDVITAIVLTTPNGSVEFTGSVAIV